MSENIHEALDNLEAQLTALVGGLNLGDENGLLEIIGENIEAVRVEIETRSIAEVVAQNTNFADLSTALNNLNILCQSITKVSVQNIFQPNTPPAEPGGQSLPAPFPFEEVEASDDIKSSRRCWAAHRLIKECIYTLDVWNKWQLDELLTLTFYELLASYIAAVGIYAVEALGLATYLSTVAGLLNNIVLYVQENSGGVEFSTISTYLTNNYDDLVCALFEAPDVLTARSDFIAVLNQAGLDSVNRGFMTVMLANSYMNLLYYADDPAFEAVWKSSPPEDCTGCDNVCDNRSWGLVSDNGSTITIQGVWDGNDYAGGVYFDATESYQLCGDSVTINDMRVVSGAITGNNNYRMASGAPPPYDLWWANQPPPFPFTGVRVVYLISLNEFTIEIDYTVTP